MKFTVKSRAAAVSIASNSLLILLKAAAGLLTGSISLIAEAIHSTIDLVAAIIAFISVSISDTPADEGHPFGHGKAENMSGLAEALLIFVAGITIAYEAVDRIIHGETLQLLEVGIGVIGVSIVINIIVSMYSFRVARKTDSLAMEARAKHLVTDILTMAGVLVGLIIVRLTGHSIFDRIAAILVSLLIMKTAYDLLKKSVGGLMDTRLPKSELDDLISYIREHSDQLIGFHEVRTRKAGSWRFIDLHLVMPQNASVREAHQVCDHLEQGIKERYPNSDVTIHVEPCTTECAECRIASCDIRLDVKMGERRARP